MKQHDDIQQGSPEWHQKRKGKVTGTMLKKIMGSAKTRDDAKYEIIAARLTVGLEDDSENAMDRGTRLEPEAIDAFIFETGKKVEITGFCEDDDDPTICNSPDGLIPEENAAVEVKCMGGKNHVKMWLKNEVPDEYEWQVVQYFVINPKLKRMYFIGYNPDIEVHPLHIITIEREEIDEKVKEAKIAQKEFLAEVNEELAKIIKL